MGQSWIRLAGVGVLGAVLAMILQRVRGEYAAAVRIAAQRAAGRVPAGARPESADSTTKSASVATSGSVRRTKRTSGRRSAAASC